ncbi:MAG: hypothetical protein HZA46_18890 [Planctomycetales bacterium]|nr:hypothetical protein [Planctomycetales bacterium]
MFRENLLACLGLAVSLVGLCGGCGSADAPAARTAATPPTPAGPVEEVAADGKADKIAKAMAQLSDEDRALAEKQKVCLVAGSPLGGMGKPYKVTVKGRYVFLCCAGCESDLLENPDKYLAKLDSSAGAEKATEPVPEEKKE